jgi:hypothetical protein
VGRKSVKNITDLINRIKVYNIDNIHIKYSVIVYNCRVIENCISRALDKNRHFDSREIYNIDYDMLIHTIDNILIKTLMTKYIMIWRHY